MFAYLQSFILRKDEDKLLRMDCAAGRKRLPRIFKSWRAMGNNVQPGARGVTIVSPGIPPWKKIQQNPSQSIIFSFLLKNFCFELFLRKLAHARKNTCTVWTKTCVHKTLIYLWFVGDEFRKTPAKLCIINNNAGQQSLLKLFDVHKSWSTGGR